MQFLIFCLAVCSLASTVSSEMINVKAVFPSKEDKQGHTRLVLTRPLPELKEITVCHWVSSGPMKPKGSFTVSYSTGKSPDEFLVGFLPTSTVGTVVLQVSVRDKPAKMETKLFYPGQWHHVCVTWSAGNGRVVGYIDGKTIGSVDNIQQGQSIRWRGTFIIGQDQDIHNGKFDLEEAWEGSITDVQVWDQVLPAADITSMAQCDSHKEGNIVAWLKTPFRAYNGLVLSEVNLCKKRNC